MRRTVIDDCWGVRWTLRTRYDRHAPLDSDYNRRKREPELRSRLRRALGPHTGQSLSVDEPAWGSPLGADDLRDALGDSVRVLTGPGYLAPLIGAIFRGVSVLREPTDSSWIVELQARGRIRRGATWRVGSRADAERVQGTVVEAVRRGRVPQPDGTLLVEVVDERLTVYGAPR